ncbi:hypothetical protein L1887_19112 [Cichorium endivia]|nr:hypothetical protein L1887_19112 [Cichorium endivia]
MCVEALGLNRGDVTGDVLSLFNDVQEFSGKDFRLLVGTLHQNLTSGHDLLYRIIDFYFKEEGWKMTEEEGSKICNYIACSNLSPEILMHAVQNPRMPLRFVVQAMFVEQLNTRRSVFSAAKTLKTQHQLPKQPTAATAIVVQVSDARYHDNRKLSSGIKNNLTP